MSVVVELVEVQRPVQLRYQLAVEAVRAAFLSAHKPQPLLNQHRILSVLLALLVPLVTQVTRVVILHGTQPSLLLRVVVVVRYWRLALLLFIRPVLRAARLVQEQAILKSVGVMAALV